MIAVAHFEMKMRLSFATGQIAGPTDISNSFSSLYLLAGNHRDTISSVTGLQHGCSIKVATRLHMGILRVSAVVMLDNDLVTEGEFGVLTAFMGSVLDINNRPIFNCPDRVPSSAMMS